MRPHGRADVDASRPRAWAICQRCGFLYNHDVLSWQYQWGGLRLINLRILVCPPCKDEPQIQLRTLILPPDPQPIEFAVPEDYDSADNPISPIGYVARDGWTLVPSTYGTCFSNLTEFGGVNAAFDGNLNKQSYRSATIGVSLLSNNFVGKYWNAGLTSATNPSSDVPLPLAYNINKFVVTAPSDQSFLKTGATSVSFQGGADGITWTTLYSTTSAGTAAEQVTSISSNFLAGSSKAYQYHRIVIAGDQIHQLSVSQLQLYGTPGISAASTAPVSSTSHFLHTLPLGMP